MAKTLYEILGVAPSASDGQLLAAFQRIRARLLNARDAASIEALQIAREAYAILSNPSKRALYDEKLAKRSAPAEDEPAPDGPLYLPHLYARCKERLTGPVGDYGAAGKQALDFSVFRQPSFLLLLAAAALVLFLWFDGQEKSRRLEAQLAAAQQEAAAAKNDALKIREQALAEAQAELARRQQELAEKQAETNRQTVDVYRSVMTRQIDSQSEMADRNLELMTPKIKAETERTLGEARWSQAQARNAEIAARQREHEYNSRISRETIELARESALLGKIQQQRLDGEDGISRSNPGANR
ncbi:MAG: DnaJ domain-containing protein [Candidatus Methylumidiphilus sp.]